MRHLLAPLALALPLSVLASGQSGGNVFCGGNACPCANDTAEGGCGNGGLDGDPTTGALLSGPGASSLLLDEAQLDLSGLAPDSFASLCMGDLPVAPVTLGDGLLCIGSSTGGVMRFPPRVADADGRIVEGGLGLAAGQLGASVTAGSTWYFQAWYRDAGGPCANGSNLTNAMAVTFQGLGDQGPQRVELAGRPLATYPFFERPLVSNQGEDLWINLDPTRFPLFAGVTVDVFVVAYKSQAEWAADPALVDVSGGAQTWTVGTGDVTTGSMLVDAGTLNGTQGVDLGVPYSIVIDVNRDGALNAADLIDGYGEGYDPGVVVVRDPVQPGPYASTSDVYNLGPFQQQKTYWPTNIASLGRLPLLVVSHGNGHSFQWYDHIGSHMASYGFVVMSHTNNTSPGIETASDTTLINTDSFLGNLDIIAGGVLVGHVDREQIAWIGHSRGGEGVVRAYDKLKDGEYLPEHYDKDWIRVISSIAPTSFLGFNRSNPRDANYHLWVGSADSDVTGTPNPNGIQSFPLYERGFGSKSAIVLHGVGHGAFHAGSGGLFISGPCQLDRPQTHDIMRGALVPLLAWRVRGDPAGQEFAWRQWEGFGPIGRPIDPCVTVNLEHRPGKFERLTVDDYHSQPDLDRASSRSTVTTDLLALTEGRLQDGNNNLVWSAADDFNGFTRANGPLDQPRGAVLVWDDARYLQWELTGGGWNVRDFRYLNLRAAPIARHPNTTAALGDLTFDVTLVDRWGTSSTLRIDAYGGGVEEPYQRAGGWSNEFELLRLPLDDFLSDGRALDLARVTAIRLDFAGPGASPEGAIGIDDLEFTRE